MISSISSICEDILIELDRNNYSPKYKGMFTTIEEGQRIVHGSSELSKDDHRRISDQFPFWAMNDAHLYYRLLGYFSTFYNGKILKAQKPKTLSANYKQHQKQKHLI